MLSSYDRSSRFDNICTVLEESLKLDKENHEKSISFIIKSMEGNEGKPYFFVDSHIMILELDKTTSPTFIAATGDACFTFEFNAAGVIMDQDKPHHDRWQQALNIMQSSGLLKPSEHTATAALKDMLSICFLKNTAKYIFFDFNPGERFQYLATHIFDHENRLPSLLLLAGYRYHASQYEVITREKRTIQVNIQVFINIYFPSLRIKTTPELLALTDYWDPELLRKTEKNTIPCFQTDSPLHLVYKQIYDFMTNPEKCLAMLAKLEEILSSRITPEEKSTLLSIHQHKIGFLYAHYSHIPIISDDYYLPTTNRLITNFLEEYLTKHGFLLNGKFVRACGFIKKKLFQALNEAGILIFEDYGFIGTTMVHRDKFHAVQIWLLCEAVEAGEIHLPEGMSVLELLKRMHIDTVNTVKGNKKPTKRTVFTEIFDLFGLSSQTAYFLPSLITSHPDRLPLLWAISTNSLTKHVRRNLMHFPRELVSQKLGRPMWHDRITDLDLMAVQLMAQHGFAFMGDEQLANICRDLKERSKSATCTFVEIDESEAGRGIKTFVGDIETHLKVGAVYIKNAGTLFDGSACKKLKEEAQESRGVVFKKE